LDSGHHGILESELGGCGWQARRRLLLAMLALWALPEESLEQHLSLRKPRIDAGGAADVAIGRAVLARARAAGQAEGGAQVVTVRCTFLPFGRCRVI
jgi:hypothetical protein